MAVTSDKNDNVGNANSLKDEKDEYPLQGVLLIDDWDTTAAIAAMNGEDEFDNDDDDDGEDDGYDQIDNDMKNNSDSFRPITYTIPKVLLPIGNTPMINYSIQFLQEQCFVQELFIVCTSSIVEDYITKNYINTTRTKKLMVSNMTIHIIRDNYITNAGDALRELDRRGDIIKSDPFILCWGDCITNIGISMNTSNNNNGNHNNDTNTFHHAIQQHKARKQNDSAAIMTCTFLQTPHASSKNPIVGIDPTHSNRIVLYDSSSNSNKNVTVPCSFYHNQTGTIQLHNNLQDTNIDICSPDVITRFSDEFDYRHIRNEFITNSVAEEEEGLQNKVYATIITNNNNNAVYSNQVTAWSSYHSISQNLLRRYIYPIVPDSPITKFINTCSTSQTLTTTTTSTRYSTHPHFLYIEAIVTCITSASSNVDKSNGDNDNMMLPLHNTIIGQTSIVRGPGMIGISSTIGNNCSITQCTIGRFCTVHDNVTLNMYCYLWDNVVIESNVIIESNCIIANNVTIQSNCIIKSNCIIGPNCIIPANTILEPYTRISCHGTNSTMKTWIPKFSTGEDEDDDDDDDDKDVDDPHENSDDDYNKTKQMEWLQRNSIEGTATSSSSRIEPIKYVNDGFSDDDDDDGNTDGDTKTANDQNNMPGTGYNVSSTEVETNMIIEGTTESNLESNNANIVGRSKGVDIVAELKAICLEFDDDSGTSTSASKVDNLIIEINSFKFSQNASYSHCTMAAMMALLEKTNWNNTDGKLIKDFKSILVKWKPLFTKMTIGLEEEKAIIIALYNSATTTSATSSVSKKGGTIVTTTPNDMRTTLLRNDGKTFRLLLQTIHDDVEIVTDDAILAWAADTEEMLENADSNNNDNSIIVAKTLFQSEFVQQYIQMLDEDSDEEDDEDDEDDDDDE